MTDFSGEPPSFDPRSWKRATAAAAIPVATPTAAPPRPHAAATGARPPMIAALAGSAAILIGGAIFAYSSRPAEGPPAALQSASVARPAPSASADAPRDERRTLVLSGAQDLEGALIASGVDAASARGASAMARRALKPSGEIRAAMTLRLGAGGMTLIRLEASNDDSSGVIVEPGADGFTATPVAADLTSNVVVRRGTMDADSFYSSAVAAGVIDSLIPDFAAALAFDFDFQREVKKGDAFEAAFEQRVDRDGRVVGPPKLLYAALSTQTKAAAVYRFAPEGAEAGWFDGDGVSVKRALLRTPVDGARVSSNFGFRIHPVLGFAKLHKGTDFAAPTGTSIFASGDGVVTWAAMKGANGNLTILQHDNGWQTYYLHQSAFAPGIAPGARVSQGQEIGKVGTTGRSTGPHLHYELHIDGAAVDPLSVKTDAAPPLAGQTLAAFKRERDRIDVKRASRAS
jgi:murein DD-endopeptidase MepM/ murein hydrolase activator NlpD